MRVAGSLVCILLLFILTAALVMVEMEKDSLFSITMATIWFINCESRSGLSASKLILQNAFFVAGQCMHVWARVQCCSGSESNR